MGWDRALSGNERVTQDGMAARHARSSSPQALQQLPGLIFHIRVGALRGNS
jgi:hypothetical protein